MSAEVSPRVTYSQRRWRRSTAAFIAIFSGLNSLMGCGPDFPNWLLAEGDQAVLVAPEGNFAAELARMNLGGKLATAIPPGRGNDYASQSSTAEVEDLKEALTQAQIPEEQITRICREHQQQRQLLSDFNKARTLWNESNTRLSFARNIAAQPIPAPSPVLPRVQVVTGLPTEFVDYFEGFLAWQNPVGPDRKPARGWWEKLLSLPPEQRRRKSTWAAFMLGKSWEGEDPEKALGYFQKVREFKQQGYKDSLGLAAASLGLEARIYLNQTNYERAIERYLEQMATGDPTATNSLAFVATKALSAGPEALLLLARNPRTQKVITAYVISRSQENWVYASPVSEKEVHESNRGPAAAWLTAVEEASVRDVDSAEALALAAYRANDMALAERWIKRARGSLLAQWLEAKLLLREGKIEEAAGLLARISSKFPIIHEGTNAPLPHDRKDTLSVSGDQDPYGHISAERQLHGELGVLRLSRGEYVQALDTLLNAGFWMDAAYVAERVLTLDELKGYVDRFWPQSTPEEKSKEQEQFAGSEVCPALLREQIRYLLARRLTRESRSEQAREYYPATWVGAFDARETALRAAWDEGTPSQVRAAAFFEAAMMTRTNGMELIGTEVSPDWHYHDGQFDQGVSGATRGSNAVTRIVHATDDELKRNAEHVPNPDHRFHYRYLAASLAWEAASLLPDNDDITAYVLWQGGSFLKNIEPQMADSFYKALVRRNRKTILGAEADRRRWFPGIDADGNILPRNTRAARSTEEQTNRDPGSDAGVQNFEQLIPEH